MDNNNAHEDSPMRFDRPRKSRSIYWKCIKLMDDNDLRIIKHTHNHVHQCTLCSITSYLSCTKNRKYGKSNVNYQTAQVMCHFTTKHVDIEDTVATIAAYKSKIEVKKKVSKALY